MAGEQSSGRYLFIVNKYAGLGYPSELEDTVASACRRFQKDCAVEYTQRRGHATELAKHAASQGFDIVVAVGGDGTINEVAQGLLENPLPMGIVPRGSGNGLGRHLGIPLNLRDAIYALFESRVLAMDVFTMNGKLSLNVSGLGFDGHVTHLFGIKSTRGFVGYITLTVKEFFRFNEFETTLISDGKTITRDAFIIAIANSSQYGNNARIAPPASVCDGMLDISILKKVPLYRFDFLYEFFTGNVEKSAYCEILQTKSLEIKTKRKIAYHVDGEACGDDDSFSIKLYPAALQILCPIHAGAKSKP